MNRLLAVILFLTSFLAPFVCLAALPENQQMHSVHVGKLRHEISAHEEKIDQSGQQELSLLDELDSMDEKITKQKVKINAFKAQIKEQER